MPSSAGIFKEHRLNFILDEGKLRKIVEVLEQYRDRKESKPRLAFSVLRRDDSWYETAVMDDVFADDNATGKEITSLMIDLIAPQGEESAAKSSSPLCRVRFRSKMDVKVDFAVNDTDRDWCFLLADDLDTQVQRTLRPRHLRWLRENPLVDMGVCLLLFSIPLVVLGVKFLSLGPGVTQEEIANLTTDEKLSKLLTRPRGDPGLLGTSVVMFITALFILVVETRPISKMLNWLDRSVFYWKDQQQVFDAYSATIAKIKWGVVIAFFVSLAASVSVTLVAIK